MPSEESTSEEMSPKTNQILFVCANYTGRRTNIRKTFVMSPERSLGSFAFSPRMYWNCFMPTFSSPFYSAHHFLSHSKVVPDLTSVPKSCHIFNFGIRINRFSHIQYYEGGRVGAMRHPGGQNDNFNI